MLEELTDAQRQILAEVMAEAEGDVVMAAVLLRELRDKGPMTQRPIVRRLCADAQLFELDEQAAEERRQHERRQALIRREEERRASDRYRHLRPTPVELSVIESDCDIEQLASSYVNAGVGGSKYLRRAA